MTTPSYPLADRTNYNTLKKCSSFCGLHPPGLLSWLRPWIPLLNKWIKHDSETTQCWCAVQFKKTPSMASNYAFHFHLAINFRLCIWKKNVPASAGLYPPGHLPGLRPWTPLLNRWIKHSQQTMNQDKKLVQYRRGTSYEKLGGPKMSGAKCPEKFCSCPHYSFLPPLIGACTCLFCPPVEAMYMLWPQWVWKL